MPCLKWMSLTSLVLLPLLALGQDVPHVRVELRDLDPAGVDVLPPFTPVHARIGYQADTTVRLVLHPYRDGEPVLEGVYYSGSPHYPAGEGEGLAWFAFNEPQRIDEIRAIANDGRGNEFARDGVHRRISWRAGAAKPEVAAWVEPLKQRTAALAESERAAPQQTGWLGWLGLLLMQGVFLMVPASVVLQIIAVMTLDGAAGGLARLSALAMGLLWLFVIVTAIAGSNLSPIWLVFLSPLFVVLLTILLVHRRLSNKRRAAG